MNTELVKNKFMTWGDDGDESVPTATLQIYDYINENLNRKPDTHVNRASSASMCVKRRWFQRKGTPGEKLTPRKLVNFMLGDLSEATVKHFIREGLVGPGKMYSEVDFGREVGSFPMQGKTIAIYEQEDLTAELGEITATAHVDGWGKRSFDGKWELIEVKSASDYGFKDFKISGISDYMKQATVNLMTGKAKELGATEVRFFFLKKQTGNLWDRLYPVEESMKAEVIEDYRKANADAEPETPYSPIEETFRSKPTGRRVLPWQCHYCPYTAACQTNATMEWKNNKPLWVVNA